MYPRSANGKRSTLDQILKSPKLPSIPAVAVRLLELAQDIDCSNESIAALIKSDPALAVKILRSANSSYFSFRSEVKTLEQAVALLGRTVVTSVALSFSLAAEAMDDGQISRHYHTYWKRSLVEATAAELLAQHGLNGLGSELFMTGLLIDIGQLALLRVLRTEYADLLNRQLESGENLCELEESVLGLTHAQVGAALMEKWQLPSPIVESALWHHEDEVDATSLSNAGLVRAMRVVALIGDYVCDGHPGSVLPHLRDLAHRYLGFDEVALNTFLQQTNLRLRQSAQMLSTDIQDLPSPDELMSQAMEQLAEITIRQDREKAEAAARQLQFDESHRALEHQNERLRAQVFRDALTNVYNRRYFNEAILQESRRAVRTAEAVGALFVDADFFKRVNDTYGHSFGDEVLQRLAKVLCDNVRTSDIVARFGGEEFVVLALQPTEAGLRGLAERIRASVESMKLSCMGQPISITVSIGCAIGIPQRCEPDFGQRLLESADAAMYESKRRGRNCVTLHPMFSEFDRRISQLMTQHRFSQWLVRRKLVDAADAYLTSQSSRPNSSLIGELAVKKGWLLQEHVQGILRQQERLSDRFGAVACQMGLLSEMQLAILLSEQIEDPSRVAARLVAENVLEASEAQLLLAEFRAEQLPLVDEGRDCRCQSSIPLKTATPHAARSGE